MKPTTTNSSLQIWLNSATAYILAGPLVFLAHECAHLVAGLLSGERGSTLTGYSVDFTAHTTTATDAITTAAGPLFSLITGYVLIRLAKNWGHGFWRLFWLWFGFLSAMEGVGYLIITPFGHVGDTGHLMNLLHAPNWIGYVLFVVGVFGMFYLGKLFATPAVRYTETTKQLRSIGLFAWLAGTIIMVLVSLPALSSLPAAVQPVVLMGTISLGIFTPLLTFFFKKVSTEKNTLEFATPLLGIGLAIAVDIVIALVINPGVHVG